jgi:hypothetical protein
LCLNYQHPGARVLFGFANGNPAPVVCCTGALLNVLRAPFLAQDGRSSLRNSLLFMGIKISSLFIKKLLTLLSK